MANEGEKEGAKTRNAYVQSINTKASRKLRAKSGEVDTVWLGLGMMGLIGWSIVIPTLIGVALGRWMDRNYQNGYSWTLMLLILGLLVGCLNAWYWVIKESKKHPNVDRASETKQTGQYGEGEQR